VAIYYPTKWVTGVEPFEERGIEFGTAGFRGIVFKGGIIGSYMSRVVGARAITPAHHVVFVSREQFESLSPIQQRAVMIHEMVHSKQWWEHGVCFYPIYWRAGQEARRKYWGPDPPSYYWNPYEVEAFKAMYEYLRKYGTPEDIAKLLGREAAYGEGPWWENEEKYRRCPQ
jgi:hypothetical protein